MNGTIKVAALAALLVSAAALGADQSTANQSDADQSTANQSDADQSTANQGGADQSTATRGPDKELPEFSALDTNRDRAISKDEAREQSWVASRFGELDADKNGKLNSDEYKKAVDMMKPPNP